MTEVRGATFVTTIEHRRFTESCDACKSHRYVGLCYGPPGVGKTLSARRYTRWDQLQTPAADTTPQGRAMRKNIARSNSIFLTTPVVNSPGTLDREIRKQRDALREIWLEPVRRRATLQLQRLSRRADALRDVQKNPQGYRGRDASAAEAAFEAHRDRLMRLKIPDPTALLVIDEADRLTVPSLEQVRDTFDRGGIGLVLIGMPDIEKRLARYPQLYSRVGFVHEFRTLDGSEMRRLLQDGAQVLGVALQPNALADEAAVAAILRVTGGNFRLLHRLLTQIARVLEINGLNHVTVSVVDAARESLVIGVAA
jgi:DNA transposition AAA+ family ATPase